MTHPTPPGPAEGDRRAHVDPELDELWRRDPGSTQRVAVWFRVLPDSAELGALGLLDTGGNPATGVVDHARLEVLARRPDVERVVLRPSPHPF